MNKHQPNSLIALNPEWRWQDFTYRCQQISQQLQQDNIQSAAFWFEDAANYACAMLACFDAKTRILLPPNLLDENQEWIRDNADMLFDDNKFNTYGISQVIDKKDFFIDEHCQTEIWLKTSGSSGQPKIMVKTAEKCGKNLKQSVSHFLSQKEMASILSQAFLHSTTMVYPIESCYR